jgi:hypothetical protein
MTAATKERQSAMRVACSNLLVLATMMYSADHNQLLERIVIHCSTPLEA